MNEFEIINKFFSQSKFDSSVILGVGDDAAIVKPQISQRLAICVDTLIAGVHFPLKTKAEDIAYKAVAVNLSDLAAMGATPKWITLALTMPHVDIKWLKNFSKGLTQVCHSYNIDVIGGDTTCGFLSITVQALGYVPTKKILKRSGAKVGDKIYLTGVLGEAALGLQLSNKKINVPKKNQKKLLDALNRPIPCMEQGILLRNFANSCIDISDGFLADLQHILTASHVGAVIDLAKIPLTKISLDPNLKLMNALTGGDDYALCFTVPKSKIAKFEASFQKNKLSYFCVGEICREQKLKFIHASDFKVNLKKMGYQHF